MTTLSPTFCVLLISAQVLLGQTTAITYQGRLNANGVPASGVYDFRFTIYGVANGGKALSWPLTNTATVNAGLFTVSLNVSPTVFDGADRWLEIWVRTNGSVGGFTILAPRQQITATPYALGAATYNGTVAAGQVIGALPASQLSGTVHDTLLSTNVALINGNQTFRGANAFSHPGNNFIGNGAGLTNLSADRLTSGKLADARLSTNVALLHRSQTFGGDHTSNVGLRLEGPGTNNWLMLSNGSIWLPPFTFPAEDGGDAQRGGIYFAAAGQTGPVSDNAHYILNIINRGTNGGQLLISHQNIALEEQIGGSIILGNDGTAGGLIRIRYDDAFGQTLTVGQAGYSHPLLFEARTLAPDGRLHESYPSIIGFHGRSLTDLFPSDPAGNYGPSGAGVLAFYTSTPWPQPNGVLVAGREMGRMETNGWNFRGTMTYQKSTVTLNSGTSYALDFGTNNYLEINLNTSPMRFTTLNRHAGSNSVQSLILILHAGTKPTSVTFPPWKVLSQTGTGSLPTSLAPLSTTFVRLEIMDGGDDANTFARFESYVEASPQ